MKGLFYNRKNTNTYTQGKKYSDNPYFTDFGEDLGGHGTIWYCNHSLKEVWVSNGLGFFLDLPNTQNQGTALCSCNELVQFCQFSAFQTPYFWIVV